MSEPNYQVLAHIRRDEVSLQWSKEPIFKFHYGSCIHEFRTNCSRRHVTSRGPYHGAEIDSFTTVWEVPWMTNFVDKSRIRMPELQDPRGVPTFVGVRVR
jgi:hypothetical protein